MCKQLKILVHYEKNKKQNTEFLRVSQDFCPTLYLGKN